MTAATALGKFQGFARAVTPRLFRSALLTGNLDTATAESVLELLDELHAEGMTVLVITHDPAVAAHGGRTVTIRDGVLTEQRVGGAG